VTGPDHSADETGRELVRESSNDGLGVLALLEAECSKLARELHDGVGQMVTALKMELAMVKLDDSESAERLSRARALAGDILDTVRNISTLLKPTVLDDLGLTAALDLQVRAFAQRAGVTAVFESSSSELDGLTEPVRISIYRVVQEALNNSEKYSSATNVFVSVETLKGVLGDTIFVRVSDNGCGIQAAKSRHGGLGIRGMKERAALLGGTLEVESSEEKGTTIILAVPVDPPGMRAGFAGPQ
jgi:two-component system, NarL family, sensor histidine kinase UhpB